MKIGVALSGGGARGVAHLGVMKALDEKGIRISHISGTSAGAIVGALYAYGYTPDEIIKIILNTSLLRSLRPALAKTGLLRIDSLYKLIIKYIPEDNFDILKIPLTVAATEIRKGRTVYFSEGELIRPIMASSCVPVIFRPMDYKNGLYVDGGLLNNLPVEPIKDQCDFVLGIHTNPIDEDFNVNNVKTLIERSLLMAINGNTQKRKAMCDLVIEPPGLKKFAGSDWKKAREMYDLAYQYVISNFESFNLSGLNVSGIQ